MSIKVKKYISFTLFCGVLFVLVLGLSKLNANSASNIVAQVVFAQSRYSPIVKKEAEPEAQPVFSKKSLTRDKIELHRQSVLVQGLRFLKDQEDMSQQIMESKLVEVSNGKGFILGDITHSFPFLTPDAKEVLDLIGISFYTFSGDSSVFTVSSLTRTMASQKRLRKRNSNATQNISTHCYGVSFDISYIRYNGERAWSHERTQILEGVLAALQESGKLYVIKERQQSCFHITVR